MRFLSIDCSVGYVVAPGSRIPAVDGQQTSFEYSWESGHALGTGPGELRPPNPPKWLVTAAASAISRSGDDVSST